MPRGSGTPRCRAVAERYYTRCASGAVGVPARDEPRWREASKCVHGRGIHGESSANAAGDAVGRNAGRDGLTGRSGPFFGPERPDRAAVARWRVAVAANDWPGRPTQVAWEANSWPGRPTRSSRVGTATVGSDGAIGSIGALGVLAAMVAGCRRVVGLLAVHGRRVVASGRSASTPRRMRGHRLGRVPERDGDARGRGDPSAGGGSFGERSGAIRVLAAMVDGSIALLGVPRDDGEWVEGG